MSSSCIPTGLRLDLDMVKAAASPGAHSSPLRPVHSSPSSTLSEASNASSSSATSVSLKRARAPRKRPNQAYNEAAALLASIHPSVFPVKKSPKTGLPRPPPSRQLSGLAAAFDASSESDLLPPLPVLADSAFLLRDMPAPSPSPSPQPLPQSPSGSKNCSSPAPVSSAFRDFRDPAPSPASPDTVDVDELGEIDFDDDGFDAESILDVDGAAAEGLDGIMGSLTVESNSTATTSDDSILSSSGIHPYLRSLMVVGLAGRFELGLGFRHGARPNLNRALKRRDDDGAWWMWPAVPVKDLTIAPPTPPAPPASNAAMPQAAATAPEKKKSKKKKVVKVEKIMAKGKEELPNAAKCKEEEADASVDAANGDGDADGAPTKAPKTGLGLKLDADEVLKAWSDKGSMFAEGSGPESPTSGAEARAKLADIDLFPENGAGGGIREASVLRYKEKRRTRLFSKKIRYQVRKVNADCRPRMKGRFVRSPSLLQQALEEES